jgi:hypothetical protein
LGFPTGRLFTSSTTRQQVLWHYSTQRHQQVFWRRCRGKRRLLQGEFRTHILYFVLSFALLYFYLFCSIKNTKKNSFLIVVFTCPLLVLLEWLLLKTPSCDFTSTNNSDFICTPIAPPTPAADFYKIKPALLNLVMKEQFSSASSDDVAAHLNNFVELCEMQKYKDVESVIIKLKLFPFSLRGKAKDWLLSLPENSIDSCAKCKDAFIGRYYPPAKIIALCSNIMKISQFDNEHVAQACERMKSMIKNCPTHGLTTWMIVQTFYA